METMRLPAPRHTQNYALPQAPQQNIIVDPNQLVPPYGHRTNYVPRKPEDYGDGGAFPEIHVKQYPLDMGRKRQSSNALQLRIDAKGKTNYDVVVREGQRKGKNVFTQVSEMEKMDVEEESLARPTEEEADALMKSAQQVMEDRLKGQISSATKDKQTNKTESTYIRYTPADKNSQHNSGAKSRIIKLVSMQVDPLEPPKFRHKKLPARPPSPPVPVMRSPPRNVTQEDQKNWKIPPCISNWKNNRGYAIPLHQRLATSGRGLQDTVINPRFAALSEVLYLTERRARTEVRDRAEKRIRQNKLLTKAREKELRGVAEEARQKGVSSAYREIETPGREATETPMTHGSSATPVVGMSTPGIGTPGIGTPGIGTPGVRSDVGTPSMRSDVGTPSMRSDVGTPSMVGDPGTPRDIGTPGTFGASTPGFRDIGTPGIGGDSFSKEEIEKRNARDRLREDARRRAKRKYNMEKNRGSRGRKERDISEKIALGQNVASQGSESMFHQGLFNKDEGMSQGFGASDSYNIYDKPMSSAVNTHIYRPTKTSDAPDEEAEMEKILKGGPTFQPHKGFKGSEGQDKRGDGPVQFERQKERKKEEEDDPFNIQDLSRSEKKPRESRKRRRDRSPDSDDEPRRRKKKKSKKKKKRKDYD